MTASDQTAPAELRIHPAADLSALRDLTDQVTAFIRDCGASPDAIYRVCLVLEEMVGNVIRFGGSEAAPIDVAVRVGDDNIAVEITDHGSPFDPSRYELPALPKTAADVRPGDMGLRLVMDIVGKPSYRRANERNIVRLDVPLTTSDPG